MIHHFYARQSGKASEVLSRSLSLTTETVLDRIAIGALYVRRKRVVRDEIVLEGDYIRFHDNPKRFAVDAIDWAKQIVFNEPDFLIVDKPHGLPTHQTLDNVQENLRYQLSEFLGEELLTTHRLDQPTRGLLVLAKNARFQRRFNFWLESGKVTKRYRAICEKPVPLGPHVHYMVPSKHVPKEVRVEPFENGIECKLEVESCELKVNGNYEAVIRLFTGRTHQIRAQFAELGAPIIGDVLYGSAHALAEDATIKLTAIELGFDGRVFHLTADS